MKKNLLYGKEILVVDDEPDILDTLVDLLSDCSVTKAATYTDAKKRLKTQTFDIVILDIMGVRGYDLLALATQKNAKTVMLTAHAMDIENTVKSYQKGAAYYIPKEEMHNIEVFLCDVLEAEQKGKNFWWRWLDRFADLYDKKFGPNWRDENKEVWEKMKYWI